MGEIDHDLEGASLGAVIGTGLLLGVVHVITGPDHLSALIVLSAGSSWRSCQLGVRWGCGHSAALIVLTVIFLAVDRGFDLDAFGTYCDFVVGLLMMALGVWSLAHYLRVRRAVKDARAKELALDGAEQGALPLQLSPANSRAETPKTQYRALEPEVPTPPAAGWSAHELHDHSNHYDHHHGDLPDGSTRTVCFGKVKVPDIKDARTQKIASFGYGLIHGLAGTGGVLGVLPAVMLDSWGRSMAYILAFSVASIFIMGAFAALYGEATGRITSASDALVYRVGIFSSLVSLVIGVLWVVLVATDQLDAVFG